MLALEMRGVRFKHRGSDSWALDGLDLDVRKGEFVTLLGANGSGKTTACMLANGLIPHAIRGELHGTVRSFGMDVRQHSVSSLATRVGMVFQEPESQLFCMSVEEEISFGPENLAVPRNEIQERLEWALDLVGMRGYNARAPSTLSGGEKQRVAIAAALSMRPDMLVLDEPAYALDPIGRIELYSILREIRDKHGMTVVIAERDAEEVFSYSDRIVLMARGRVLADGTPNAVLGDPERLREVGVEPVQLSEVSSLLNKRLSNGRFSFITVEDAESEILRSVLPSLGGGRR